MSRTVFILGAGASKEAGGPVMSEFLNVAEGVRQSGEAGRQLHDFELVLEGRRHLQQAQAKFAMEFDDIESVFAAFEIAAIAGRLGTMDADKVRLLPAAMKRLIYRTLEVRIKLPWHDAMWHAPNPYEKFLDVLRAISDDRPWERCCVITLNYDLCLDYALNWQSIKADYCLEGEPAEHAFRTLKLHGSLNWGWCPKCQKVSPWYIPDYLKRFQVLPHSGGPRLLQVATHMESYEHSCGERVDPDPFIVPPTWNKTMHRSQLENVWRAAAAELAEAEEIIVIGYSLPETDSFFRYLLAVGTAGRTLIDKFWVYDLDSRVGDRFYEMLGAAAKARFRYHGLTFSQAVPDIDRGLKPAHASP